MTSNEPESPGGWVVDLRNPDALQRALESAGGMPPRKGRRRKDPTPTAARRPSAAGTAPGDLADTTREPPVDGDDDAVDQAEVVDGEPDGDDHPVRTTSGALPSRRAATAAGSGASQISDDPSGDDDAPVVRHGDESLIAQAHVPESLEQQRRRRQWAFGGTAAVAVVACALLIKGLSGSTGGDDNASLSNIPVVTAAPSVATTPTSAATATSAGTATTIGTPLDPLALIPTVRNAPAQYGFYLDGNIVLQGTVPSKSKGAEMKLAAGDLVGNDHVKPAYVVDSSVRTVPHPPLYIANPIRFDTSGNLDAVSQAAVKSAADLMIAAPGARMAVLGFTSAKGSPTDNLTESKKQADAVVTELVRLGVPQQQLFAQGRGATDPMADNTTSKGRAANERVELVAQGLLG